MMQSNSWEINIQPTRSIPFDFLNHIHTLLRETFIEEGDVTHWSDVDWHILITVGEELVSHVEIVEREAFVGQESIRLGGIGGVLTLPAWRGRGLAKVGMQKTQAFMCEELGVDFGLLMCDQEVVPFYSKLGWVEVEGPLVYDQPEGKVVFDDKVMIFACSDMSWPQGMIDIRGYPW
jgi:predicted GNAT family N-acyltransferase